MQLKELAPSELNPPLRAVHVTDKGGLAQVSDFFSRVNEFGLDCETNVVDNFVDRKLRTIQIGNKDEQYVIDLLALAGSSEALIEGQGNYHYAEWAAPVVEVLKPVLESKRWRKLGMHLQFDYEAIKWGLGIRTCNLYDCYLAEKVLYAGKVGFFVTGFWALDDLVARYCGMKISKDLQKSFNLEDPLTQDQVEYAALDTRLPFAIRKAQTVAIATRGLNPTVECENQAIPSFGDMRLNGIYLDKDDWLKIVEEIERQHAENLKALDTLCIPLVGSKYELAHSEAELKDLEEYWRNEKDRARRALFRANYQTAAREQRERAKKAAECPGEAFINYGSPDQVVALLRKAGFGPNKLPDTNDRSLKKYNDHPVIQALQAFRTTEKALKSYGREYPEKYINGITGRVHPTINQIGAETGRTSANNPNCQNVDAQFRPCFKVEKPGWKFIVLDMAGAELRILAEASGEPAMVEAFQKGWDVHSVGAEIIFGDEWRNAADADCAYYHKDHQKCACKGHKKLRNAVKAINFGIAYGMEAKKLSEDLKISEEEAKRLLKKWREAFPVATRYLEQSGLSAKQTLIARTLLGRVRYFNKPDWERAREKAVEKAQKKAAKGVTVNNVPDKEVSRSYYAQYSSIEREGKNTPFQGTNADILKLALALMWDDLEPVYGAKLVNEIHDEVNIECPEETAEACAKFVGECIRKAGAVVLKKVTMEFEFVIGECWKK